jgi:hypothetical protein
VSTAPLSIRALTRLARERLGPAASALKTREELELALGLREPVAPVAAAPAPPRPLVTRDFFVARA